MYGTFRIPVEFVSGDLSLSVKEIDQDYRYVRQSGGERVEKILTSHDETVIINPVEPVNLPDGLTRYLELEFEPVVLQPGSRSVFFLKFPVEIGVFLKKGDLYDVLDIISLVRTKYSLYGLPENGILTRWYRSPIYRSIPETDKFREGVMQLTMVNSGTNWIEVSRAVFESTGMHLFYGNFVAMNATMEIFNPKLAVTRFSKQPFSGGMTPSLDLYVARNIPIVKQSRQVMEHGVV